NMAAARFLIALAEATGSHALRTAAERAIETAAAPGVPESFGLRAAALLTAALEARSPWAHATLVAQPSDPAGDALWRALTALDARPRGQQREPGSRGPRGDLRGPPARGRGAHGAGVGGACGGGGGGVRAGSCAARRRIARGVAVNARDERRDTPSRLALDLAA